MAAIFHIAASAAWQAAQTAGIYRHVSLEAEGFIHCSTAAQVVWVANSFFKGQSGLILLQIAPERLQAELRFEPAADLGPFPHLYGELNLDAVVETFDFPAQPDGTFQLPSQIAV